MNIIDGMMMPLMNCAPKAAEYSSPFFSSKAACDSFCRPNTLTSPWPVNVSSMMPLS